jgi:hypothetical protein
MRTSSLAGRAAFALLAAALAACGPDAPTAPAARPAGPAMLLNPACADTGAVHPADTLHAATTWSAAASPHHVTGTIFVEDDRLTIEAGARICFGPGTRLVFWNGGYLRANGTESAGVVLTATDPAAGWQGLAFAGEPAGPSRLKHTLIELVDVFQVAVLAGDRHAVNVDSSVVRQVGRAAILGSPGSRMLATTVDTTTYRYAPAVELSDSSRLSGGTIRGAAGIALHVNGSIGIRLTGGVRIEGAGDVGIWATLGQGIEAGTPVRVVGGATHPARLSVYALARLYPLAAEQDSLVGNGRDTVLVSGGTLRGYTLAASSAIPWRVLSVIDVDSGGDLRTLAGARMAFGPNAAIHAANGGRVVLRGALANPAVLTADDPALGWGGIVLDGATPATSYVSRVRIEHTYTWASGVAATGDHTVYVDTVVFRHTGRAVLLHSAGSRISYSRVDTTLNSAWAAVDLAADADIASTLIRGSSGEGLAIRSATAVVTSCHVTGSVREGILLEHAIPVTHCNLVDNGGVGLRNDAALGTTTAQHLWWGDAAGPTGTSGDGVAGLVDHTPWLTSPYTLPFVP